MKVISQTKCFDGVVSFYSHLSSTCQTEMKFSVFLPPQSKSRKVPVLYWLSGLTCTEENFTVKAGVQKFAAENGIMIVASDTSPRGETVAKGDHWDIGQGAGFYVNATEAKWLPHYKMYDYVAKELPQLISENFPIIANRQSIFGHSMGGHGALIIALREKGKYLSVSAFSPICAPTKCAWGKKAFSEYLGSDTSLWSQYDASELVQKSEASVPILIDQGTEDKFYKEGQLLTGVFKEACLKSNSKAEIRMQLGYDHSYYFISTFMKDHIDFHSKYLNSLS